MPYPECHNVGIIQYMASHTGFAHLTIYIVKAKWLSKVKIYIIGTRRGFSGRYYYNFGHWFKPTVSHISGYVLGTDTQKTSRSGTLLILLLCLSLIHVSSTSPKCLYFLYSNEN